MQTSGVVLDVFDDGGESLKGLWPEYEQIPSFVKQASALSPDDLHRLPDDAFALVLVNDDGMKLRKFACVDQGHTALSILYFVKNAHKLPDEARALAAENLKIACGWYDLDVPEEIEKEAGLGSMALRHAASNPVGTAMTAMSAKSLYDGTKQGIQQNLDAVHAGEAMGGAQGGLHAMAHKHAEVSGTALAPNSADQKKTPTVSDAVVAKTANMGRLVQGHRGEQGVAPEVGKGTAGKNPLAPPQHMKPVMDVTGKAPRKSETVKKASRYALGENYPLDSYDQVKLAAAYFEEYGRRFAPADRHEFCTNLVKRASELSIPVADIVRKYGSEKYASADELQMAIDSRRSLLEHDGHEGHRELLSKIAEAQPVVPPEDYVVLLTEFDKVAGIDHLYDAGHVMDPYYSTYGFTKTAEENFTDLAGNTYVTGADLKRLTSNKPGLHSTFGHDFYEEFCKDPIGIYKSLPAEQKKLVARMATENSPV